METEITCILTEACGSNVPLEKQVQEAPISTPVEGHNRGRQLLRRRKQINTSFLAPRNPYQLTNTYARRVVNKSKFPEKLDEVTQRVLSGKEHRIKQLENDLGVAQIKLCELAAENRLLRSLNKRNNAALSRFQDVEAELPSLLSVHNSEIRSLRERFSKLSFEHREQARELRSKDSALQSAREQLSSLNKLVEEKGLKERQTLADKLEECKDTITELEEQHKNTLRQLMLEKKSFKHQLSREQRRYNDLKLELNEVKDKISTLENKLKIKEKFITDHLTRKEFHQARRNFASFKTVSMNSEQKTITTSSRVMSNRAQTSSTVRTCELHDDEEDDDDDVESELSFSMANVAPSVDSIMNHLHYSSSDTDEEVSQIYRGRPTSVPQLALSTTSSTPWAVDSRTFSIRTTETSPVKINSAIRSATIKIESKRCTPITTVPSPIHQREPADQSSSPLLQNENNEPSDEPGECEKHTENLEHKSENESSNIVNNNASVTRTTTPVQESEVNIKDNYSKEALLAALKAIDAQQVDSASDKTFTQAITNDKNHISSKKVELMQELFSTEESGTSLHDSVVTTEQ